MTLLDALRGVKGTLNEVEVKGEDNMDRVLACIRMLKECIKNIENPPKKEADKDAHPDSE